MEHQNIYEYMQKSREERRAHLKLDEPCTFIGGYDSREYRGLLAHKLLTTIPSGRKYVLCHACHQHACSNPNHLYWGTGKDNIKDQIDNGTWKSLTQRTLEKYGPDAFKQLQQTNGLVGGLTGGRGRPKNKVVRPNGEVLS